MRERHRHMLACVLSVLSHNKTPPGDGRRWCGVWGADLFCKMQQYARIARIATNSARACHRQRFYEPNAEVRWQHSEH
ncbi:uncharacterized protein Dsimw501_GD26872 [Drosophila simulans]|nr:uncharacterized protein Dsimw501_GD26872 [Drosophila simulans]